MTDTERLLARIRELEWLTEDSVKYFNPGPSIEQDVRNRISQTPAHLKEWCKREESNAISRKFSAEAIR